MDQTMNQVIQQHLTENPPLTLEVAKEKLRALLSQSEENAWEIGDLLNRIENEGLARHEGFGKTKTWLEFALPETQGMTTVLYRYASVAAVYSKQQLQRWRVSKLEMLMAHDREMHGQVNREDPVDREVELLQPDGSTVVKKFHDCSYRALQHSLRQRKTSSQAPSRGAKKSSQPGSGKGPSMQPSAISQVEKHSLRTGLAMLGAGTVLLVVCEFLPRSLFSGWLVLGSLVLSVAGIGICFRHWKTFTEQLHSAFKEGRALEFLKERMVQLGHGADKLAATVRGNLAKTRRPPHSSQETTNETKKAA